MKVVTTRQAVCIVLNFLDVLGHCLVENEQMFTNHGGSLSDKTTSKSILPIFEKEKKRPGIGIAVSVFSFFIVLWHGSLSSNRMKVLETHWTSVTLCYM